MSLDPNAEKSAYPGAGKSGADNANRNGLSGMNALALNTFLVVIAVLVFQFFFVWSTEPWTPMDTSLREGTYSYWWAMR